MTDGVLLFLWNERSSFCLAERARGSEHQRIHPSPRPSQHGGKHLEHGDAISSEQAEQKRTHANRFGGTDHTEVIQKSEENNQNCQGLKH